MDKILIEFTRAEVNILGQALTEYLEGTLGSLARHLPGGSDQWDTLKASSILVRQKLDRAQKTKPVLVEKKDEPAA